MADGVRRTLCTTRGRLAAAVVVALSAGSCTDDESVLARWRLAEPVAVDTTSLRLDVLDPVWNCGVRVADRVVRVAVNESDESIEVEIRLSPIHRDHVTCQADVEPEIVEVDLDSPVGDRLLIGASAIWPGSSD